ncbi:efflux RND transporter permease subunit [Paracoccus siganidrum]|uniref:Efflux RND transporter permease subunit n=1 Tax=Paracoccus siganidrum TaxID=1276757 RepID=A0A419AC55_9RHOB|nr:efflux RND transporter permease subunit [Paracoccus siganidrum]RJL21800.1 efflux RND transporter permease subunit [Paracoccus siganidrum]RMC38188.1 multidrug transporter AcrB [Paracoccus siganidrum]
MTLPDLSLRRPVLATVLNLLIVLIGAVAMSRLPVRELPQVDTAEITVRVEYTGASPEVVDNQVAAVVEGALAGIAGLTSMETRSDRGRMRTVLTFDPSRDIDSAANDVRGAIERIVGRLPDDAEAPQVEKNDDEGDPVLRLALSSTEMSPLELSDYARRYLVDRLARLPGVAAASLFGERAPAMRIWLDQSHMAAHGVTTGDVIAALQANNLELPAGEIETGARRLQVLAQTRFTSPEEFRQMVIRSGGERPLRLGDVARIEQGPERNESYYRSNGMIALGIGVQPQAQANTVAISDAVLAELERIRPTLPDGMSMRITSNEAVFIESSIKQVTMVFFEAVALVTAVIFLFLGSARLSLVPLVTIPISMLGAMLAMMALGFSINILTLFALILAIGLVVDDAIIVLENIQRHKALGERTPDAVRNGTNQVNFAVIATTIVLVSVFLPVSFMEGEIGRLFAEFGIVLAVSVAVSSIVALTLTPVMAERLLPENDRPNMLTRGMDRLIHALERGYRAALSRMIARPVVILSITAFAVMASVALYRSLPQELTPQEDRGQLRIFASGPQGVDLSHTDSVARRIEAVLDPMVEDGTITNVTSIVGMWGDLRRSLLLVTLADWDQRSLSSDQIMAELRPQLDRITDATISIRPAGGLGISSAQGSIRWMLGGPDIARASEWAEDLAALLQDLPGLGEVEIGYNANQPGADLIVDRLRAQDLGLDSQTVAQTLQVLFASRNVGEYYNDGRQYPVVLQAEAQDRASIQDMLAVQLRNNRGDLIPLSAFATIQTGATVPEIRRYDRLHSIQMEADLLEGTDLAAAIATVEAAARHLPAGAVLAWSGQAKDYINSSSGVATVFAMSLAIVFLVLAAQFESFRTPLTIMLTVPLGLAGAVLTLFLVGASVNIFSQVGLVLLVGLMAKNGILIVEFSNQLRAAGRPLVEAAIEGAVTRMRPVMMTTIAMVLGAVPLATATGAGAESRRAIGMVITGGLSFAFVLTLCVTPVIYVLVERVRMRPKPETAAPEAEAERAARIGAE